MHISIDMETLGVGHKPVVLSVALVAFDPLGAPLPEDPRDYPASLRLHHFLNLEQQVEAGLEMDPSTVLWWMQQDEHPRYRQIEAGRQSALGSLQLIDQFIAGAGAPTTLWSYGGSSDAVWIESLYRAFKEPVPFSFRDVRCLRTAGALSPALRPKLQGQAHDALDDAYAQARWVQAIYQYKGE